MDAESRSKNFLGLELMNMFNPKLLTIPFEGRKIPEEFKAKHNINVSDLDLSSSPQVREFPNLRLVPDTLLSKASPEHTKRANKLNAPLWQVIQMENTQKQL
ncbi:hypothetical protein BTV99_12680, partial [Psychrobacter sp. Rd 27.2]